MVESRQPTSIAALVLLLAGGGCSRALQVEDGGTQMEDGARPAFDRPTWDRPGGPDIIPAPNCGARDIVLTPASRAVMFVVGRSSSMRNDAAGGDCGGDCGAGSKWAELRAAIGDAVAAAPANVAWGLSLYPSPGAAACEVAAGSAIDVPVAASNGSEIVSALGRQSPEGGRPVSAAVDAALQHLRGLTESRPMHLVLVTDGAPECAGGDGGVDDDLRDALASVNLARLEGVSTSVLGVATGADAAASSALAMLASEGGGGAASGSGRTELATALGGIVRSLTPCAFVLPRAPTDDGTTSRLLIDVSVGGKHLPRDPTHSTGWDYLDQSFNHIQLYGQLCEESEAGTLGELTVTFRCLGF